MIDQFLAQLKRHEGFRGQPYQCTAGKTTIAYGRNLEANPITEDEGHILLINDVEKVIAELNRKLDISGLKSERQAVLINMAFNMGVNGLLRFKNMLAAIGEGDFDRAAVEMLDSKWADQVGKRATELAEQMRTGQYAPV